MRQAATGVHPVWLMSLRVGPTPAESEIRNIESATDKVQAASVQHPIGGLLDDLLGLPRDHRVEVALALADTAERFYLGTRGKTINAGTNETQWTVIAEHWVSAGPTREERPAVKHAADRSRAAPRRGGPT